MIRRVLITTMFVALANIAVAQQPPSVPSVDEIVNALDPKTAPATRSLRGIEVLPGAPVRKPSVDLVINFEYNSAKLEADGLQILKRLGEAMKNPRLSGFNFLIAGHTDSRGSVEYNQTLSERRAKAVRDHLMFFYDVPADRLAAIGYGKTKLLDAEHPESEPNRRVQIINEGTPVR